MNIQSATPFGVAFFVGGCYEDQRWDLLHLTSFANYTDWTNNIVQYRLPPHCTICLIPSAFTPESIRDKIYKILAYYINHIGIKSFVS